MYVEGVAFGLGDHHYAKVFILTMYTPSLSACFDYCYLEAISCGDLHDPQYGSVQYTGTVFQSTARYTCDTGFEIIGDERRTCQGSGKWTGSTPSCRREFK